MTWRLFRALTLFAVIFHSYGFQLTLARIFRRTSRSEDGKKVVTLPPWLEARRERVHVTNARRLKDGMLRLRGVFIKLGQVLSLMGGFLPRAYGTELESLQDQVPSHPFREIDAVFRRTFGKRAKEVFASIEEVPIAAASLGQVHVARTHAGEKVAVKVLYPGIRDVIVVDMRVIGLAMRVYKKFMPIQGLDRARDALDDLLRRETDYEVEATNMERMAANFASEPDLLFPKVLRDLTTKDVLTMTFMEGVKITRTDAFAAMGVTPNAVATLLVRSFYKSLFLDRFFHADPHPGNFLVQAGPTEGSPRIVVLDFGAICDVPPGLVDGLLEILQAVMTNDGARAVRGFRQMGFAGKDSDDALIEKTVLTYFQRLLKIEDRTAGALMRANSDELRELVDPKLEREELRDLLRAFDYPEGWFYVERGSVLMFWLCAQIDPTVDTVAVGMPYVVPLLAAKAMAGVTA
ncbi:MAG: AarF/UbiB family protein [Polyangiaceae bacterium]